MPVYRMKDGAEPGTVRLDDELYKKLSANGEQFIHLAPDGKGNFTVMTADKGTAAELKSAEHVMEKHRDGLKALA